MELYCFTAFAKKALAAGSGRSTSRRLKRGGRTVVGHPGPLLVVRDGVVCGAQRVKALRREHDAALGPLQHLARSRFVSEIVLRAHILRSHGGTSARSGPSA